MNKRMTALLLALVLLAAALPLGAMAAQKKRAYIIPDSDTRLLTYEELWQWDYESIGYIFNEIFARHGYNFIPGNQYDNYFRTRPWYTPNADSDNSAACYSQLSDVEWANERLCKDVRAEMRSLGTSNPEGMHFMDYVESGYMDVLSGFKLIDLEPGQKLNVYSAPSENSWRGASGKAKVSTNGSVYAAGWVNGWLLMMYETNSGAVRVGYIHNIKGAVDADMLFLMGSPRTVLKDCTLTDDPATGSTSIRGFSVGEEVTYLTSFQNGMGSWAYVESTVNGQVVRGFIPMYVLSAGAEEDPS